MLSIIRQTVRKLANDWGFTLIAVFSIALGIGTNATVFSWIRSVMLNPLTGLGEPERMVTLETLTASGESIDSSYPDFRDFRDRASTLAGVIAFSDLPLLMGKDGETKWIWAESVSGNFFDVLGARPAIGRFFSSDEKQDNSSAGPVVVISHQMWKSTFNSDPGIIGKTIHLNRSPVTVVGVAANDFHGSIVGLKFDAWFPLSASGQITGRDNWMERRQARPLHLMARLKEGITREEADAEVKSIAAQLSLEYPQSNRGLSAVLLPIRKAPYGAQSVLAPLLKVLMGVSVVVLLIVCANLANMILARATRRQREIAICLALGAGRKRVVTQLMTESVLLAFLGGVAGLWLAFWMADLLRWFVPSTHLPIELRLGLDHQVFAFALLLCFATALLFGVLPALRATQVDVQSTLRDDGRTSGPSRGMKRTRRGLVVAEMALALVALVGAGLLIKSFQNAQKMKPGFDPEGVVLVGLNLGASRYDQVQGLNFLARLKERLSALPGVQAVSIAEDVPLGFEGGSWEDIQVDGYQPQKEENMKVYRNLIAPGYFNVMRIPLMEGRDFSENDRTDTAPVVIVSQAFASRFFPGQRALGRKVTVWGRSLTVVGVSRDVRFKRLNETPAPYLYLPMTQFYGSNTGVAVHVRTESAAEPIFSEVRNVVRALDPQVAVFVEMTLMQYISAASFAQKIGASLLTVLSAVAVILAALGLYGVMAYSVAQRTRELGIRKALGAQTSHLLKMLVGEGLALAAVGLLIGVILALSLGTTLSGLLLGTSPMDPGTLCVTSVLLIGVALLASYLPARRALRIDPMVTLRQD